MKITLTSTLLFLISLTSFTQKTDIVSPLDLLTKAPNIRDFTISTSGQEAYVTIQSPLEEISVLIRISRSNGTWISQNILPFSGEYKDLEPFLSPDNLRLYFASNRPLSDSITEPKDFDIWYVERKSIKAEWGAPVNSEHNEFYPSLSKNITA